MTPIKTLVRLALGAPPEALFRMELSAASISTVAYYGDGNASVRLLNDTSHLRYGGPGCRRRGGAPGRRRGRVCRRRGSPRAAAGGSAREC
ncbi:hypothetical protein SCALM49S_03937 [Streptomyces californicus]